jgi:putative membrane protein
VRLIDGGGGSGLVIFSNPYVLTAAYFAAALLAVIIFLAVFEMVTTYKDWDEIKRGNVSVAMATGGKIFGICNIIRHAIEHNDGIGHTLLWSSYGFLLLLVAYFTFEFLTPMFKVDEEIAADNRAVGLLSMVISIGVSYVIGASILR